MVRLGSRGGFPSLDHAGKWALTEFGDPDLPARRSIRGASKGVKGATVSHKFSSPERPNLATYAAGPMIRHAIYSSPISTPA